MNIKLDLTKRNFKEGFGKRNQFIVWHSTGNFNDTPEGNANYFRDVYRGASAHFFLKDEDIVQVVREKDVAWHIGLDNFSKDCKNHNSLAIEVCASNGVMSEKSKETLIKLTSELMNKYRIPIDNIKIHRDVAKSDCPVLISNHEYVKLIRELKEFRNENHSGNNQYSNIKAQVINVNNGSYLNVRNENNEIIGKVFPNEIVTIMYSGNGKHYIRYKVDNTNRYKEGYVSARFIKKL